MSDLASLYIPTQLAQKLVVGLEVDLELITDQLAAIPFIYFDPYALVVWGVGVRLPVFKVLAGGAVVYFVVCVGVAALSAGQRPLLLAETCSNFLLYLL